MNIVLQNVAPSQLPLIEELARVLGLKLLRETQTTVTEDAFYAQLDRRSAEFEAGTVQTLTLDELEQQARAAYGSTKRG